MLTHFPAAGQDWDVTNEDKVAWIAVRIALLGFRSGKSVNAPTEEGRLLGEQFARFADAEIERRKTQFPNHVERCATCAFRRGTTANQCGATLLSALNCLQGEDIFMCHERADHDCVGYSVLKHAQSEAETKLDPVPCDG